MSSGTCSGSSQGGRTDSGKKMKQKIAIPVIFFLFFAFAPAQSPQADLQPPPSPTQPPAASIAVYRLENVGADDSTATVVSDLLFSFMREMREYSLDYISSTRAEAEADGTAAAQEAAHDFVLYGRLSAGNEGITLELSLKARGAKDTRFVSRVYENQNKLMLGTRLLVRELFDSSPAPAAQDVPRLASAAPLEPSPVGQAESEESAFDFDAISLNDVASVDALAGSWNGERGIEKIMILRGGRGAAVFSSGFSLMLSLSIEDGELVVVQRGSSSPLQFVDLPDPVAEKAAEQAPPIEWHFRISDDGNILAGLKSSVQVTHDGRNILSMTEKTEQVAWIRN